MSIKKIIFLIAVTLGSIISLSSCSKESSEEHLPEINKKVLKEIRIKTLPEKLIYTLEEELNIDKMVVEGVYDDNSVSEIKIRKEDISGFSSETAIEKLPLTLTIQKQKASFEIQVLPLRVKEGVLLKIEGEIKELTLPSSVKAIGDKVFYNNNKIETVILNEGVTSIGELAFAWSGIKSVIFPKSLEHIGEAAFYSCNALQVADLKNTRLTVIENEVFTLSGIKELSLPESLKRIKSQAFMNTENLSEIILPRHLEAIEIEAFRESGCRTIQLPNNLKSIESRAFYLAPNLERAETYGEYYPDNNFNQARRMDNSCFERCSKLTFISIPDGIEAIGQSILNSSPNVHELIIPASVREISFSAFGYSGLKEVEVKATTPPVANTIHGQWYGFPSNILSIKVPTTAVDAYKNASGWSEFSASISD